MLKLKTETNTPEMEKRVYKAARKHFKGRLHNVVFEHGQWWALIDCAEDWDLTLTFSVVDQEGGGDIDGFGFEEV